MKTYNWIKIDNSRLGLPVEETIVMTKIDDEKGERNVQELKRYGNLWMFPDGSMYVYYTPTHFAYIN